MKFQTTHTANAIVLIILLLYWTTTGSSYSTSPYYNGKTDIPCDTASNVFVPWTGYRVQLQVIYSRPRAYAMRMTYCWRGSEYGLAYALKGAAGALSSSNWVDWSSVFCLTSDHPDVYGCYRIARKEEFATADDTVLQVPNQFIGGLFKCVANTRCERNHHVVPWLPLLTDEPYMAWFRPRNSSYPTQRIPLLYTPDSFSYLYPRSSQPFNWASPIDLNEDYP